ncbi:hypothetical protein AV274_2090 [Blastocystis sp. ATCC 50177/Nand II]|uniref:Late endosomal/lysosomal adaptor and MAPK and MTOR activator 5 n=1 Tax=Blastocystis sp. subtype 1 (strain ATCC 50177 / NandII) TaxID=478820 RepID=A0A196SJP3_BLAHN|nr:hypothetical protein AV274_2090 [Blastocystis sp. ATCC 50177/Nand II]
MSSPSAILIDPEGSVIATIGSKHIGNLSSSSGLLYNIYSTAKTIVPGKEPIITIETNQGCVIEKARGNNVVCMIDQVK